MKSRSFHPDELEAAYEFLRVSEPFRRWKLPHADAITFRVTSDPKVFGRFIGGNGKYTIVVSEASASHTIKLLETIAHEILHLAQHLSGHETKSEHNADFKKKARRICDVHGFDPKAFF